MVDFSLRKTKAFKSTQASKGSNPYASLKNNNYDQNHQNVKLPSIAKKDQEKIGKLMQRRMSIHQSQLPNMYQSNENGQSVPALPNNGIIPSRLGGNVINVSEITQGTQGRATTRIPSNPGANIAVGGGKSTTKNMDLQDPAVIQLLTDSEFNPQDFIRSRLGDSTASDIDRFNSNLTSLNKRINNDIKIASNQTFDKLSNATKELQKTDLELKFLRNSINELMELTNDMKIQAEKKIQLEFVQTNELTKTNSTKNRQKRAQDRSSILVLEKMWANEMNSLFKHVEGAQKFIAAIPGRHVITESGRWYELNSATFKTLQPAHIFLLNDLVLIATRRRKNGMKSKDSSSVKIQSLVADQCWPLREVQFIEIPNSHDSKEVYTINIKYNSLSYIYQTDRLDHYNKILSGYKKARNELRDISEAENIKQRQLRDSMTLLSIGGDNKPVTNGNGTNGSSTPNRHSYHNKRNSNVILQDLSTRMHSRSRSMDNSNTLRSLKKIDDMVDELDVLIFHELFEESLTKLNELEIDLDMQKNQCNNEEILFFNIIKLKINSQKDEIIKKLINLINKPEVQSINLIEIESSINLLIKLNLVDIAKILLLNNRSSYINSLISKVEESKTQITNYIEEITIIRIQNLKSTIKLFKSLFPQTPSNLSYLVEWGLDEIKSHIRILQKSINGVVLPKTSLQSSILIIHRQVMDLKLAGLDVEYLFDDFYKSIDTK
ncbi:Exocyst complex component [Wickerhamomyces ciferrii]|uniref:Exocyst complex component EXO84 n=1 Tax=Wickerhamomyces ciferrii (strain ATCC 14091 / BCRC 22168 / CBS 111 / JCM 3599 / NBRC 0793 / NRRL Y-1031 F-60-10) TaxID=1206466 RepID=K0KVL4_WICCF|nr:Exocyst complex component [Wickerhamomyces ciferrii]CCH45982.1 Exocyst complex component [Wickerhamomyces ciferrii]